MRLKLIWDNGTPSCLPRWAREELVELRLRECALEDALLEIAAIEPKQGRLQNPAAHAMRDYALWGLKTSSQ